MYRYYIILLFFTLASMQHSKAQEFKRSQPKRFSIRSDNVEILGMANDLIYVHEYNRDEQIIKTFNAQMGITWKKKIPFLSKRQVPFQVKLQDSSVNFFYTERKKSTRYLNLMRFNLDLVMDTTMTIDSFSKSFGESFPNLIMEQSENKAWTVIYYLNRKLNAPPVLHYIVLNASMKLIRNDTIKIPDTDRKIAFYDLKINDEGRMFIIVNHYKDNNHQSFSDKYFILTADNKFQPDESFTLLSNGKFFNNATFEIDNLNNHIAVVAFYTSDYRKEPTAEGVYFHSIDLNTNSSIEQYIEFEPSFISKITGHAREKSNERMYFFVIDKLIFRKDGGVLLVAESYHKTIRTRAVGVLYTPYGSPGTEISTTFYFEDIIAMSIHPDGNLYWKTVLPKSQISSGDNGRYSSYSFVNTGNYLAFIYNDEIKYRTNVIEYIIAADGEMSRNLLFNAKNQDVYLMPSFAKQVQGRQLVIPSYKRGKLRFVKFKF